MRKLAILLGGAVALAACNTAPSKLRLPPPALLPADQATLDRLRAAGSGPAFDMAFQQAQISAHQAGIQLMQNYAASGDVPALRAVASQAIPVMQGHLAMAQALQIVAAAPPPPPPPLAPPPTRRAGE